MSDDQRPNLSVAAPDVTRPSRNSHGSLGNGDSSPSEAAAVGSDECRASSGAVATACEAVQADRRPLINVGAAVSCDADPTARQRAELASRSEPGSDSAVCSDSAAIACVAVGRNDVTQATETGSGATYVCRASRFRRKCALPLTSADEVTGTDFCYASHAGFFDAPPACVCAHADSAGERERLERWERWMDGASIVAHITPFAIVGVCVQFLLDELFGPGVAHVTNDALTVFVDLPANMLGAFLLGLSAVALLPALLARSRHLAIAVVVGLCGSISTFATWNQRMLSIATSGLWARAAFGYFTGSALPLLALVAGVDAGTAIRHASASARSSPSAFLLPFTMLHAKLAAPTPRAQPPHHRRHMLPMLLLSASMLLLAGLGALLIPSSAQQWRMLACACLLAPLGTYLRYLLLRFNGAPCALRFPCAPSPRSPAKAALLAGEGEEAGAWEWMPWGTWMANVGAAGIEAAISVIYLKYQGRESELAVGAMQLGFLACLSTVSMPCLEALYLHYTLRSPAKAYLYALLTIAPSFVLGLLVYSVPCWLLGFDSLYSHIGSSPQPAQP
ncbi:hypothetical protein CLOM_g10906 [Closterium sp. NIES-68]|nr:hypothetical protein CLOM_g10906 [Closterium sp. NIES-68]GJP57769.1 hypothetical protein CLOP_g17364 [Closterium sp. NIES-67]